jgi:N-acetylmuramoyl-L-alanine amidase
MRPRKKKAETEAAAEGMRPINRLVVHCSATPNGKEYHAADIDRWHKARGWDGIGYHFVIALDGSVEPGRPVETIGAHVEGHNRDSIGICLIGTDEFNSLQHTALARLLADLRKQYPAAEICGHRDFPDVHKLCPGFDVRAWCRDYGL